MDLKAIRKDLSTIANQAGFNSWSYQPDDPKDLPAAVVGGVKSFVRLNQLVSEIQLPVTFFVSLADPEDATNRLDTLLSVGNPDSFIDRLDAITSPDSATVTAWRSIRFISSGAYIRYAMPGGSVALGVELTFELTA